MSPLKSILPPAAPTWAQVAAVNVEPEAPKRQAEAAAEGESPAQERRVEFSLVAKDAEMEALKLRRIIENTWKQIDDSRTVCSH